MKYTLFIAVLLGLAACSDKPEPQNLSLFRHYSMVDQNGNRVGSVTFKPVGPGEIRDSNGQLIGVIMQPEGAN